MDFKYIQQWLHLRKDLFVYFIEFALQLEKWENLFLSLIVMGIGFLCFLLGSRVPYQYLLQYNF